MKSDDTCFGGQMVGEPTNINDRLTQQRPGTRSRCPRQDRRNRLPERLLVRRRPVMSTSVEGRFLPFAACRKEGPQHPRLCRESTQQGSPAGAQGSAALGLIGWSNNHFNDPHFTTHSKQTRNYIFQHTRHNHGVCACPCLKHRLLTWW